MTVALFPCIAEISPTVVWPLRHTASPTEMVVVLDVSASASFFEWFFFSSFALIFAIFLDMVSSFSSFFCNPFLKEWSSWRAIFVFSFSASASLMVRMVFSMRAFDSAISCSAFCLASFRIRFRSFSISCRLSAYLCVISSSCFSRCRIFWRLFSQYRLSRTMSCRYLSISM